MKSRKKDSAVRASDPGLCANVKVVDFSVIEGSVRGISIILRIVGKTGDSLSCRNIVGGFMSYRVGVFV